MHTQSLSIVKLEGMATRSEVESEANIKAAASDKTLPTPMVIP
jgi:hypothetical protein